MNAPRFRLEGAGLVDTEGNFDRCTGCGKLPPHAGCQAICAACAPPTGACYCAGCQVVGKASPPPTPALPCRHAGPVGARCALPKGHTGEHNGVDPEGENIWWPAPAPQGEERCPRPHHLLIPGEVCPTCHTPRY